MIIGTTMANHKESLRLKIDPCPKSKKHCSESISRGVSHIAQSSFEP